MREFIRRVLRVMSRDKADPLLLTGIDMSDQQIKVVVLGLSERGEGKTSHRPLDPLSVEYEAADFRLMASVIESCNAEDIVENLARATSIGGKSPAAAAMSVAAEDTYIRSLTVDATLSPEEIEDAVLAEAERFLPYSLGEAYLDYALSSPDDREQGVASWSSEMLPPKRLTIVACRREVVDSRIALAKKAGLSLKLIEPAAFASARALELCDSGSTNPFSLMEVDSKLDLLEIEQNAPALLVACGLAMRRAPRDVN